MTADQFDVPTKPRLEDRIPRDDWGRPLVVPPGRDKAVGYTRCTTYVDCLEDKWNLQQWELRMCALGLAERDDLLLSVAAHRDNKDELNRITKAAKEAARSSSAATVGTALHTLTELVDRGEPLPTLPESARRDLAAYQRATEPLDMVAIEQFGVLDSHKIGGTWDRVVMLDGQHYIADVKTGSIEYGAMKIACQLAVYSRCTPYDWTTETRHPYPFAINQERALVIHLPSGQGECALRWIDIERGWQAVAVAQRVREWRRFRKWYTDVQVSTVDGPPSWPTRVEQAETVDDLRALWAHANSSGEYTDELHAMCLRRKAELEGAQ